MTSRRTPSAIRKFFFEPDVVPHASDRCGKDKMTCTSGKSGRKIKIRVCPDCIEAQREFGDMHRAAGCEGPPAHRQRVLGASAAGNDRGMNRQDIRLAARDGQGRSINRKVHFHIIDPFAISAVLLTQTVGPRKCASHIRRVFPQLEQRLYNQLRIMFGPVRISYGRLTGNRKQSQYYDARYFHPCSRRMIDGVMYKVNAPMTTRE